MFVSLVGLDMDLSFSQSESPCEINRSQFVMRLYSDVILACPGLVWYSLVSTDFLACTSCHFHSL